MFPSLQPVRKKKSEDIKISPFHGFLSHIKEIIIAV